jgi:hypothetical protein
MIQDVYRTATACQLGLDTSSQGRAHAADVAIAACLTVSGLTNQPVNCKLCSHAGIGGIIKL